MLEGTQTLESRVYVNLKSPRYVTPYDIVASMHSPGYTRRWTNQHSDQSAYTQSEQKRDKLLSHQPLGAQRARMYHMTAPSDAIAKSPGPCIPRERKRDTKKQKGKSERVADCRACRQGACAAELPEGRGYRNRELLIVYGVLRTRVRAR